MHRVLVDRTYIFATILFEIKIETFNNEKQYISLELNRTRTFLMVDFADEIPRKYSLLMLCSAISQPFFVRDMIEYQFAQRSAKANSMFKKLLFVSICSQYVARARQSERCVCARDQLQTIHRETKTQQEDCALSPFGSETLKNIGVAVVRACVYVCV